MVNETYNEDVPYIDFETEKYTVKVPYEEEASESYETTVYVPREMSRSYNVNVPYIESKTESYTVMVPYEQQRTAMRTVVTQVPETRYQTICVDEGHWETNTRTVLGCACSKDCCGCETCCPTYHTVCENVWCPNPVTKKITYTTHRTVTRQVPYNYTVTSLAS